MGSDPDCGELCPNPEARSWDALFPSLHSLPQRDRTARPGRGGSRPAQGGPRRPRAGDRHAEERIRAWPADQGRTRRADGPGARRADPRRPGRAHRRHPARPGRGRAGLRPPAPARRRPLARAAVKSGICLFIAAAAIGAGMLFPVDSGGPGPDPGRGLLRVAPSGLRHMDGGRHHGVRGAGLMGAEVLPRAAAAPARAGRPGPRSRTIRRHRPWPGSPRLPHRPDPRRPAGPQVTAAPDRTSRPSGPGTSWHQAGARRGMTPMKPVPGPVPPRLPDRALRLSPRQISAPPRTATASHRMRGTRAPQGGARWPGH